MKKVLILLALLISSPALAQQPAPTPAPITNSCNLLTILKGLNATNFLQRVQTCNTDDLALAVADAQAQNDNASLACYVPLQTIIANQGKGGVIYALQLYRDAKRSGLIVNCLNWLNSTAAAQ